MFFVIVYVALVVQRSWLHDISNVTQSELSIRLQIYTHNFASYIVLVIINALKFYCDQGETLMGFCYQSEAW